MTRRQVTCIVNHNGNISEIGGQDSDGKKFRITKEEAIQDIYNNKHQYYVLIAEGHEVEVCVVSGKFLRTIHDGIETNNLDNLPFCPVQSINNIFKMS